jgi:hypothetical protein
VPRTEEEGRAVSGHVILKGAYLALSAERAEGAPEAMYGVECLMCEAKSGLVDNDPKPVEVWALEHARTNGLSHGQFLVTTQRHWRVDPLHSVTGAVPQPGGDMSAVVAPAATDAQQQHRPGAHARPRGQRLRRPSVFRPLRRLVARAGRAVGALVLSGGVLGSVLFAALLGAGRGGSQGGGGA